MLTTTRRLAVSRLVGQTKVSADDIERFVAEHSFPIVEGSSVTFVYRGSADAVNLKHWIYALPSRQPFTRLANTDFWYFTEDLPPASRIEYKIEVIRGDVRELIEDPLNPQRAHDPFGANSVCHAEGYELPDWIHVDPEARTGTLEQHAITSAVFGGPRSVTLYFPARFRRTRRYPLLVVHDGGDFLRFASLKNVLDNLIHRLDIPPLVAALTHPVTRNWEYANNPLHAAYLTQELVPWLEREYPLIGQPSGRCLMGASLGAVASFSTAWRTPGFFGRLLLQSGSFAFTDIGKNARGPTFDPIVEFVNGYRESPTAVSERVFLTCGIYESLIYENRSLLPLLQASGMDVRYVEARDGHNWENWRDRLRDGLSWLFPGPLWYIYE
jgi:enterochelin esterase family protein